MELIDAFTYLVRGNSTSLLDVSKETSYLLSDLLNLNPELHVESDTGIFLEPGTKVQLPVSLRYRAPVSGPFFNVRQEENRLQCVDQHITELSNQYPPLALPLRTVRSKTEQILDVAYVEADRQLERVEAALASFHDKRNGSKQIHHLVDVSAVKRKQQELEEKFSETFVPLESYKAEYSIHFTNQFCSSAHLYAFPGDGCCRSSLDAHGTKDDCIQHTHRWEFAFCGSNSYEEQEVWAVLSCQPITALFNAIHCRFRDVLPEFNSSFAFISGAFYVDGEKDISEAVRHFDPTGLCDTNASYHRCPVLPGKETTFGDLKLRRGEMCVFRHFGKCDHYFYLQGVSKLSSVSASIDIGQYPHRIAKKKDRVMLCTSCQKCPSTVALYPKEENDQLTLNSSPRYYCEACYELMSGTSLLSGNYLKIVPSVRGEYFTY